MRTEYRASVSVEAALVLPFTVLALALFLGVLRSFSATLALRSALFETAETLADYSCLYEMLQEEAEELLAEEASEEEGALDEWLAEQARKLLLNRAGVLLAEELMARCLPEDMSFWGVADGQRGLSLNGSRFFFEQDGHKALIRLELRYQAELLTGGTPFDPAVVRLCCVTHAFLGDDPFRKPGEARRDKVYRIGQGGRYHTCDCFLINKNIREMMLWEAQGQGLEPCTHCCSWEGATVYVSAGGECYHAKGCAHLYPNLTELEFDEARAMGLEPCRICLGEEEWFVGNE